MAKPAPGSTQTRALRVAVVGGGVVGLASALELRRRGAEVAVYERGTELGAGATMRAAGMLGVGFEWGADDPSALAQLALRAGEMWPEFASRVERQGGGEIEFSQAPSLSLAQSAEKAEQLEKLAAACQARGLEARLVGEKELKRIEPAITAAVKLGLVLPGDWQVEPPMLLQRLGAALARAGVGLKLGRTVERIVAGRDFLMPDGDKFDRVVLATGSGPTPVTFVGKTGERVETGVGDVVPVKGQMLALAPVEGGPQHVIHAKGVYIAPKKRWVLVGATTERGVADTGTDRRVIDALRILAGDVCGTLMEAPEAAAWAGVRPGTRDDAPMIGETGLPGVHAALGCYRNGILFAPAVAELVADGVLDGRSAKAFNPLRFGPLKN